MCPCDRWQSSGARGGEKLNWNYRGHWMAEDKEEMVMGGTYNGALMGTRVG